MPDKLPPTTDTRETKPAHDLKPGDWLAADPRRVLDTPVEVLASHPYGQDGPGIAVLAGVGEQLPVALYYRRDEPVPLAEEYEAIVAQDAARRTVIVDRLRALAALVDDKELPIPDRFDQVTVRIQLPAVSDVEIVAEELGVEVVERHLEAEVVWPQDLLDAPVVARWFAYTDADPTARASEVPEGLRVPPYVEGRPVGEPAGRVVSAPPAGEDGAS